LTAADCVFDGFDAAVDCRLPGATALEFVNSLCRRSGALLKLERWPAAENPLALSIRNTTLRDAAALLSCAVDEIGSSRATLTVDAHASVFAPGEQGAALSFVGATDPRPLLPLIEWRGEGTLLSDRADVAAWTSDDGRLTLDDGAMRLGGVVRSAVRFAGADDESLASARLVDWQAPLRSTDAPGVDVAKLQVDASGEEKVQSHQ
jgi:hypothetical protein